MPHFLPKNDLFRMFDILADAALFIYNCCSALVGDGSYISWLPILFVSKNLFIGCGWIHVHTLQQPDRSIAIEWVGMQTAHSNDKNNKYRISNTLAIRSICVLNA